MKIDQIKTLDQVEDFLSGNQKVMFEVISQKSDRYEFIRKVLIRFSYITRCRKEKGVIIKFLMKVTTYSRQQLTRLIRQYVDTGVIEHRPARNNGYQPFYTKDDVQELALLDNIHGNLNGCTTKKICERMYLIFGDTRYERLSKISVAHLYNLRKTKSYKRTNTTYKKTQPTKSSIGQRKKPQPDGKPGYLRVDTVHQGDLNKTKGVYHINAVDEVTQFEVILSVERISESYLKPILEHIIELYPFEIEGFHSDNGSEYINYSVSQLLNKLHIELTKSRARRSNDNGLVESKNGSVVRKLFGYSYIPGYYASKLNRFNIDHVFGYLNFHRPCLYSSIKTDSKGKEKKRYRYQDVMTPYEKLKSLPNASDYLKPGITFEQLDEKANQQSDNAACKLMNEARQELMSSIQNSLAS